MTKIEIGQISGVGRSLFVICLLAGAVVTVAIHHPAGIITGAVLGIYFMFAIKVVQQWEKVAVLRLGRYVGLRGPGIFHIIPIVETLSAYVDQRVRVASVSAESTLTRDTVPVNVDAIVFWLVWNAEKSILEVENFIDAINMSAQTALRESIGRHELAQMITERETMGRELQRILDEKTNPWGITVQSVEIRDVRIPSGLEDAMSRQAQARARTPGPHHSGPGRTGNLQQLRAGRSRLCGKSRGLALARHEHALRSRKGKRRDGDRPFDRSRDHGPGRNPRHRLARRSQTLINFN